MPAPHRDHGRPALASGSRVPLLGFWLVVSFSAYFVAGPWAGFHGVLLGVVGALMLIFPPAVRLPRLWWAFAAVFALAAGLAFLPAAWFPIPAWRTNLENLGVRTGSHVVIQFRPALEQLALFLLTLFGGLWIAGHRASSATLRAGALAFVIGVAVYALVAKSAHGLTGEARYGFFPNRNHTATYLAMGSVCGLGCVLQALREKRFVALAAGLVATAICLWAVAGWSVSRGGVVLVIVGAILWLALLGRGYLGGNGRKALALLALAGVGLFLLSETGVKERISGTMDRANSVIAADEGAEKPATESAKDLDFRIPTALDTFRLIRDFPWTGIGAGQFFYVFPQYRRLASVANDSDSFHPESDWLWMASEAGIPATLALAALVIAAAWKSARDIRTGRDRALRAGCLAAALLVAIHGIFDVPGHRITLAWSAAFLFALSLRPPQETRGPSRTRTIPFRVAGAVVLLSALTLASAQWRGRPVPATLAGDFAAKSAMSAIDDDHRRQSAAANSPEETAPFADQTDPLEIALEDLRRALDEVPLERKVRWLQGVIALHFDDKDDFARHAFAIERALHPSRVNLVLEQASVWSFADPHETGLLWTEAIARARMLDALHPGTQWSENRTRQRIQAEIHRDKRLENVWK